MLVLAGTSKPTIYEMPPDQWSQVYQPQLMAQSLSSQDYERLNRVDENRQIERIRSENTLHVSENMTQEDRNLAEEYIQSVHKMVFF